MHRLSETVMELRGTAMRGLVQAVHDNGAMQTVDVVTHDGMVRAGIEVYQPFGLATAAPAAGSVVQLVAIGADPGDLIALPMVHPALRFGGLASGETVLYGADGTRVAIRTGSVIEARAATSITLQVGSTVLTVSPTGVAITGDLTVTGQVTATGNVTAGTIDLEGHQHTGVTPGGGNTGGPTG
jgi:phage gp45-like